MIRSKYYKFGEYLDSLEVERIRLTYEEIEKIIGFKLPKTAYKKKCWWSAVNAGMPEIIYDKKFSVIDIILEKTIELTKLSY